MHLLCLCTQHSVRKTQAGKWHVGQALESVIFDARFQSHMTFLFWIAFSNTAFYIWYGDYTAIRDSAGRTTHLTCYYGVFSLARVQEGPVHTVE